MRIRTLTTAALCAAVLLLAACGKKAGTDDASSATAQADAMAHQHEHDAPLPSPAVAQPPIAAVNGQNLVYGKLGEQPLLGYFVTPAKASGALPGVIVFHEWWGLNDNIRQMADQLAAQGYAVLAADMYGGKSTATPDDAKQLMATALKNPKDLDRNIDAAYGYLKDTAKASKIATLGWCFGGSMSFEAAQELSGKLAATVIYYGFVNDQPQALAKMKAPVLGLFGGKDGGIPTTTVDAFTKGLEAQGARPIVKIYPEAGHAFANPSGQAYRKDDAEDAWKRTLDFLGENLQSS
ncbi:MAG: Carboxymethylenebutenolidase [Nevskia sp.]|nr:Carboxymethylenebutenolidase [Nevskia sp.]